MRSRIAITALLATGALMSSGGAALGVSALSATTDASQAQYGPVVTDTDKSAPATLAPSGDTLAATDDTNVAPAPKGATKDATDESTPTSTAKAQPARQLEAGDDDKLPFTGYAAIPLLLAGLFLLVSGLVLRRSTSGGPQLS